MADVACTECTWRGSFGDTLNDFEEDEDGDLVGSHCNACPECHASTTDDHGFDEEDMGDTYEG